MYEFTSKYPAIISLLLFGIALGGSYFSFRKRELKRSTRIIFVAVRTAAIFLVLVLFIEPSVLATIKKKADVRRVVLVDESRSNNLANQNSKSRSDEIRDYLEDAGSLPEGTHVYGFSNSVSNYGTDLNADSLHSNGYETNLWAALSGLRNTLEDDRPNSITIISDGIFNAGDNPLSEVKLFQCPFLTIAAGDSVQRKDILVSRVDHNQKAFTKVAAKVKAIINVYMCKGDNVSVNLVREGNVISRKSINVTSDNFTTEAEFEITETSPGTVKYEIAVDPVKDEVTTKNNREVFLIDFTEKSTKVLLVTGGPGYDNAIVTNLLKRVEDYMISVYTLKTPGSYYEGNIDEKLFPELTAIFFLNFPVPNVQSELLGQLADKIERFKIPLVFFAGRNTDYQKLGRFEQSLPFTITKTGTGEQSVNLQSVVSADKNNPAGTEKLAYSLPQVFKNVSGITQKTGSGVLYIDRNSGEPMLINRNNGKSNSTAFMGYGFWKWELNPGGSNEKALVTLLLSSISMTLNKDKKQKLVLERTIDEFDYMENVSVTAKVFDDNYEQTSNAVIKAKLKGKNRSFVKDITFSPANNLFRSDLGQLAPDDYTIEASAEIQNIPVGSDMLRFIVDTTNTEFKSTKSDFSMLRSIADNSSGEFHAISEGKRIDELIKDVESRQNNPEVSIRKPAKFDFRENRYLLVAIVLLLGAEWFMKKRRNIP